MDSTDISDGLDNATGDLPSQQNKDAGNVTLEFSDQNDVPALIANLTLCNDVRIDVGSNNYSESLLIADNMEQSNGRTGIHNLNSNKDSNNAYKDVEAQLLINMNTNNSASPHLNSILVCPICSEYLKNPKLLPCLHSFCCSCLEKSLEKQRQKAYKKTETNISSNDGSIQNTMDTVSEELVRRDIDDAGTAVNNDQDYSCKLFTDQNEGALLCPLCNKNFEMSNEGVNGLTTNYVLANMIKTTEKLSQTGNCEICKLRGIVEEATGYCTNCKDMLCQSCWQSHSFTRFTLSHKIVPLDEMKSHLITVENEVLKCKSHHDEVLKYYCSDCSCLLCQECFLLFHQGHSCKLSCRQAEISRRDLDALVYGFNERLTSIKREEKLEYETQMKQILDAENVEVQKINDFCSKIIKTIENRMQKEVEITKNMFHMVKTQCTRRYESFQRTERSMEDVVPIVQLIEQQASDNELLTMEPTVHHRLVELINMEMKPYPVSWYSLPVISPLNPIQVKCQGENIEFSLFKRVGAKQKFEPVDSIPVQETLKEMVAEGKFKHISHAPISCQEKFDLTEPEKTSVRSGFFDATLWPRDSTDKENILVKQNTNGMKILDGSNSEWTDTDNTEDPTSDQKPTKKKKRGKKNKIKRETVDIQNLFQRHPQNIERRNPNSPGFLGNYIPNVQNTFGRMPEASYNMPYHNTFYQDHSNPLMTSEAIYGQPSWMPGDTYFQNGIPYAFERQMPMSVAYSSPTEQENKLSVVPKKKNKPQTKEKPKNVPSTSAQNASILEKNVRDSPTQLLSGASQCANASVKNIVDAPKRLISLQPKWRLDVKLSSDMFEPKLQCVFCLNQTSIIVSDVHNSKIKTFSVKGEFIKSIDIKNVGRAILTSNVLIYNTKNIVTGQKDDGRIIQPIIFDDVDNCYISWFPKGQILVSIKNKIRQYQVPVDDKKNLFIKKRNIGLKKANPLKQITDIRSNMQGQKIVVVDSSSKCVVIFDLNGNILGNYTEEGNSQWNPTSASFDKRNNVFVTDSGGNRLVFINQSGTFIQQWDTAPTISRPMFVTTNQSQPLYITGHGRYVHVYDYAYL